MSDAIRLYIITNQPGEAARKLMGCGLEGLPRWIKVVSDPFEVEKLPSGISAMGLFFTHEMRSHSYLQTAWAERRERGGIDYDFGKHQEKLNEWMQRRDAAEQRLLAEAVAEERAKLEGATA